MRAAHFLDISGAKTVKTVQFQHVQRALSDVYEHCAIGSVTGAAGLGKTYAVESFLSGLESIEFLKLMFPPNASAVTVARRMFSTLLGDAPPKSASRYRLAEQIETELASIRRLIVVDEAQNLNRGCFEFLRILHDQPRSKFGLMFVGGDGAREVLANEPMLSSRIYRTVQFQPLSPPTLYDVVRSFHPALAKLSDETILDIDDAIGHGNFRHWASFTHTALQVADDHDLKTIDTDVINNAFALLTGTLNV